MELLNLLNIFLVRVKFKQQISLVYDIKRTRKIVLNNEVFNIFLILDFMQFITLKALSATALEVGKDKTVRTNSANSPNVCLPPASLKVNTLGQKTSSMKSFQ
jgi:hypothetical protein